jgi:hypothetical protein
MNFQLPPKAATWSATFDLQFEHQSLIFNCIYLDLSSFSDQLLSKLDNSLFRQRGKDIFTKHIQFWDG